MDFTISMIKKVTLLSILISLLTSCGVFIKLDQPDEEIVFKKDLTKLICPIKKDELILTTASSANQGLFKDRLEIAAKKHNLKAIDIFVMWAIIQIYIRPNKVSPGSSLQFVDTDKTSPFYINYNLKINKDPNLLFNSLKDLLTRYRSKRSLQYLSRIVDDILPYQTSVDHELSLFLSQNRAPLSKNSSLEKFYFKGDQVLRTGEGLRTFKIWPLVSQAAYKKNSANTHLFSYKIDKDKVANCNFDMRIYQNAVYLINQTEGVNSHPFSISFKGSTFLGISAQVPDIQKNYHNSYSFTPSELGEQNAVCFIKTKNSNFSLISTKGRDSGQHLFNMIEYNLAHASSVDEVLTILEFPRYLFLLNPERMIYESDRSSEAQTQTFLNTSFPIYHKSNLGNVWIHYQKHNQKTLLIDDRIPSYRSCLL